MATDVGASKMPLRGRVLPAWAWIGWRWVWRSPAAAIVPLLQPFFFLYFLRLIAPASYFPLQVAGAMLFSTQNIGSWCLSDSAVFRIELRLQDIFVASPHDKLHYLFGVAFSNLIPAIPALIALGLILATSRSSGSCRRSTIRSRSFRRCGGSWRNSSRPRTRRCSCRGRSGSSRRARPISSLTPRCSCSQPRSGLP